MQKHLLFGCFFSLASLLSTPALAGDLKQDALPDDHLTSTPASEPEPIDIRKTTKFRWNVFSKSQGAGTPNQAGGQAFIPISTTRKSIFFLDALATADFGDALSTSSIVNTPVEGTTFSTSSRIGYRWLNDNGDILFGVNAGYDSRPISTGIPSRYSWAPRSLLQPQDVFFQQIAFGAELVTNNIAIKPYALVPVGKTEDVLNFFYSGGALDTYGIDIEHSFDELLTASIGYYYQQGDLTYANGSGLKSTIAINPAGSFSMGIEYTYDPAFEGRLLGFLRVGTPQSKKASQSIDSAVQFAVSDFIDNRIVRVHDCHHWDAFLCKAEGWGKHHIISPLVGGVHTAGEWVKMVGYEVAAFKCASDGNWACANNLLEEAGLKNQWLKNYKKFTEVPFVGPLGQFCASDPDTCIEVMHTTFDVALEGFE